MSVLRLAINGYGRIGRSVLRALYEGDFRADLQLVAINELADTGTVVHLTRYDSTHGRFPGTVGALEGGMLVEGDKLRLLREPDISQLPWRELGIDVVLECTGAFSERGLAEQHLRQGAQRVLFSQPAQPDVDATIVYGVNHQTLTGDDRIVSNASCTTNGIVPALLWSQ